MIQWPEIEKEAQSQGVSVSLVLKERVHLIVLDYLFQKGAFSELVFQGGTALRIAHNGVRYSEDLDFVLKKKNNALFKAFPEMLKALPQHLDKWVPFGRKPALKIQKDTPTFKRAVLSIEIEPLKAIDKTQIEIANVPSYGHETLILRDRFLGLNPAVCVETPEEILSDKICAFGSRKYVKGRDIWDIFFLLDVMQLKMTKDVKDMALRKTEDYGLGKALFSQGFQGRLKLLKKEGQDILRTEMDKFLPRSYRDSYAPQYSKISDRVIHFLNDLEPLLNGE